MVECGEEPEIEDDEFDKEDTSKTKMLMAVLKESRHLEKIQPYQLDAHCWRLKDRMKTVSVAIVLCLNIPVDPPDIVKLQPCARLESWIDPMSLPPQKAIEAIGNSLQKSYERWQPKARYKCSPDPTVDEIKKLCTSLRRNAKEERVLFHYNGHGVPRPTDNGEIWVFNSNYTQYIPLSIYDLQQWMGTPSIYVYDCSNAGKIITLFQSFSKSPTADGKCIHFASCGENQFLPMNPELPADVFTSCLTTPVRMAIRFYYLQHKKRFLPIISLDMLEKIPGQINDRRSMLGELNWIFTAITDTIAWNVLPRDQFQKLFRQDLLVASLYRNFILAERIMLSYDCVPISSPAIPSSIKHHMWAVWDLSLELALTQLPYLLTLSDPGSGYIPSPFFEEQLTAFQMWLNLGSLQRPPPEQLPIVLQVLLSQVYRPRALELLGTFLSFGPWAVNLVLEVGIFPYILKLLQSTTRELRPLLTHLWAKILAVDPQCKVDLVRDNKYFTNVLKDTTLSVEHRTNAAFVLCALVSDCSESASFAMQGNILPLCLDLITDDYPPLRLWATICAARTWYLNPKARWEATRDNAPDKLITLLDDAVPEVRAAAAYALGTFIKSLPLNDRSDQGRLINHKIAVSLKNKIGEEASPLVRQELLVALHYLVLMYENFFKEVAKQFFKNFDLNSSGPRLNKSHQDLKSWTLTAGAASATASLGRVATKNNRNPHTGFMGTSPGTVSEIGFTLLSPVGLKKSGSTFCLSSLGGSSLSHEHLYMKVWQSILALENDPYYAVAQLAHKLTDHIKVKLNSVPSESKRMSASQDEADIRIEVSQTPNSKNNSMLSDSSRSSSGSHKRSNSVPHSCNEEEDSFVTPVVSTQFLEWCGNFFRRSAESLDNENNTIADLLISFEMNCSLRSRMQAEEKWTLGIQRLDDQRFIGRSQEPIEALLFHPTEQLLIAADRNQIGVWDVSSETRINSFNNLNAPPSKISSMAAINSHSSPQYLCAGSDDGAVRIWKNAFKSIENKVCQTTQRMPSIPSQSDHDHPYLVTAFNTLEENYIFKRDSKLLMTWEQETATIIAAGHSDKIRLWDLNVERKIQAIASKGLCTTALHSLGGDPWIAAGFSDGYLRLFDRRNSNPLVREWKDHSSPIVTTQIFNASETFAHIISGALSGEVRLCDLRRAGSVQVCQPRMNIHCMSCHPKAHLFAVGTQSQQICVYHTSGTAVNSIRYYNGIMGHKIGAVNCLSFHSKQILLAAGTREGNVTIYGLTKR